MHIRQLHPLFAGEVSGVDIAKTPSHETVAAIVRAMDEYAVPSSSATRPMTQDQQIAWASSFGQLDIGLNKLSKTKSRLDYPELLDISNVLREGDIAPAGHKRLAGGKQWLLSWHSSSFQAVPEQVFDAIRGDPAPTQRDGRRRDRIRRHARRP